MENINIGSLPNDGTGDKLRDAFIKINQNFEELALNYKELTANIVYNESNVIIGTPLTIGFTYYINSLSVGDSFTNVGYTGSKYFIATGEYPTVWNTTDIKLVNLFPTIYKNTYTSAFIFPIEVEGNKYYEVSTEEVMDSTNTIINSNIGILADGKWQGEYNSIFQIKTYISNE